MVVSRVSTPSRLQAVQLRTKGSKQRTDRGAAERAFLGAHGNHGNNGAGLNHSPSSVKVDNGTVFPRQRGVEHLRVRKLGHNANGHTRNALLTGAKA